MSGYLVSWEKAILAHASTRNAANTLTAKRLFISVLLLKDLTKPDYRQANGGDVRGATQQSTLADILVEWQQQVKRIAEIVRLILQRDHDSIATAKSCNFQQATSCLGHGHHRPIAINRVPGCGEVPLPSLFLCRLLAGGGRELRWWGQPRDGKRQD